jgi:hypothetical protein
MLQRVADSVVLGVFSIVYSCAVFVLKFRVRPADSMQHTRPQPQGV